MLISLLSEKNVGNYLGVHWVLNKLTTQVVVYLRHDINRKCWRGNKTGWLQSLFFSSISVKGQHLDSMPIISCPQLAVAIIPCLTILCEQTWTGNNKHVPHLIVGHCKTFVAIPDIIEDRCFHADKTVKSSVKTVHNLIKDRYAIEKPWYWCYWQIR